MIDRSDRTYSNDGNKLHLNKLEIPLPDKLDAEKTFEIYELLRPILPAPKLINSKKVRSVREILDKVDGVILDGYGIINIGDQPTPEIFSFFEEIRARSLPFVILTNGASYPSDISAKKYRRWGLNINVSDIISSRDVLEAHLLEKPEKKIMRLNASTTPLKNNIDMYKDARSYKDALREAEAFAFMGSVGWTEAEQAELEAALIENPRPVFVANPDVSAPQKNGFSAEPGYWVTRALKKADFPVEWYGKPHHVSFQMAIDILQRKTDRPLRKSHIAMVGDSLHTDILGATAAGLLSVLVTDYGLMRGLNVSKICQQTSIHPHIIAPRL